MAHFPYFSPVAAAFPAAHLCLGQLLLGGRDLGAAALAEFDLFEEWENGEAIRFLYGIYTCI